MPTSSLAPSYSPSATRLILKAICITFHPWLKWLLVFYRISPKLLSLRVEAEVRTQASRPISAYTYVPPPHTYTDTHTHTHTCSIIYELNLCTHQPCRLSARGQPLGLGISFVHVCTHTRMHIHICMRAHTYLLLHLCTSSMDPSAMQTVCTMPASGPGHQLCACVHTHMHAHTHACAHTCTCSFSCALHLCTHQPCRLSA